MASLVRRFLEEENLKTSTRLDPGNLYVCTEDWDYGGPFIIAGSVLLIIYTLLVWRLYLKADKDRKLFDHIFFRTSHGYGLGLLLMMSFTLVSWGIYQYDFLIGIYFVVALAILVFFSFALWTLRGITKHEIVGEFVEVDIEDYYQDFPNTSMFSVSMCAVVQISLVGLTIAAVFSGYGTDGPPICLSNFLVYLLAAILQWLYVYHYSVWAQRRKAEFWYNIISKDQDCIFVCLTDLDDKKGHWKKITRKEINYRKCLHAFTNGLCMLWIFLLTPIHLAATELLQDIILNMIALYFIVELDDLKDSNPMIVSTNSDRFIKTSGTYDDFYIWHREQESAQEVRAKHNLANRKGFRFHSGSALDDGNNISSTPETTKNATPSANRHASGSPGDSDSGSFITEWI